MFFVKMGSSSPQKKIAEIFSQGRMAMGFVDMEIYF